jgi:hypothetical protein
VRGFSSSIVKEHSSNPVVDPSARLEFSISRRIHCATVYVKVAGPGQLLPVERCEFGILRVLLDELSARFYLVAHHNADARIRDNKFVDSGQQVCGK